jgi:hypothetical protein
VGSPEVAVWKLSAAVARVEGVWVAVAARKLSVAAAVWKLPVVAAAGVEEAVLGQ